MSVCWHCYWGWPIEIAEIYELACNKIGDRALEFGPAHVVWSDENFELAQWCLDEFDTWIQDHNDGRFDSEELEVVRQSLVDLTSVPDELKREPAGYDGENPGQYPPPKHWIMKRM